MSFPFSVPSNKAYRRFKDDMVVGRSGMIPGKTHYVRPTTDYASYDADAWIANHNEHVYDTVALALADCVSGRGDAIVLAPGTHTVATASLAMAKAGVKIWGAEAWMGVEAERPSAILTTSVAGDEIANVTAADCGILGVTIRPITAGAGIDLSAAANNFLVDGCLIDLVTPVVNIATAGIVAIGAATGVKIHNSVAHSDGAQGNAFTLTGLLQSAVRNCRIFNDAGTWASAILIGAAAKGILIDSNHFYCSGTAMTVGINGTGNAVAGGTIVTRNLSGVLVTKLVDNFDATECELGLNYILTDTGGTGGTLVTATT